MANIADMLNNKFSRETTISSVLNEGVNLQEMEMQLAASMKKNRARRKHSAVRVKKTVKY